MISKQRVRGYSGFQNQGNHDQQKRNPECRRTGQARPFVKWAGGKNQLAKALNARLPRDFDTYYEPFLGGGALFFYLYSTHGPFRAVLSDANEELVNAYKMVANNVDDLILNLAEHRKNYFLSPEKYYYEVRDFQKPRKNIERASRLLFLNKTCYNGLYRVNRIGKFNVPFGAYKKPNICDEQNLRAVSEALRLSSAELKVTDYEVASSIAGENDFLYFDPPYQPVSQTANFTCYTNFGFTINDQHRLAEFFRLLDRRKCRVMMSNSDVFEIRQMYSGFQIETIQSLRSINCLGNRRKGHSELIIRNYLV